MIKQKNNTFETPILFITFNKEDTTKKVLKKILNINPTNLIIASDGPRNKEEEEIILSLRNHFEEQIKFDFIKFYSDTNKGCKDGVTHAISKSFELFDKLIIVEDDTLPSKKFFRFCEKLLNIYEYEKKINLISGYNYLLKSKTKNLFYFSKYSSIWGWATWKNRWEENTILNKKTLSNFLKDKKNFTFENIEEENYFSKHFNDVVDGNLDSWAFGLTFSNFFNNKLAIVPKYNLVKNIGLGHKSATHTKSKLSFKIVTFNVNLSFFQKLKFNFLEPVVFEKNDSKYMNKIILKNTFFNKITYFIFKKFFR